MITSDLRSPGLPAAADVLLSRVAPPVSGRPDGEAAAALEQFEAVFTSLLLKSMRTTMTEGEMFGNDGADIWGGLFDEHLGALLAQQGGLGLMDQLTGS